MVSWTCAPSFTVSVTRYEPEVRPDPATVDGWPVQAKSPMNDDVGESVQLPENWTTPALAVAGSTRTAAVSTAAAIPISLRILRAPFGGGVCPPRREEWIAVLVSKKLLIAAIGLAGARDESDALQCRPGDRGCLCVACEGEVKEVGRDPLTPVYDVPEGATVVAAAGHAFAGARDRCLVAVDHRVEVRGLLQADRSARSNEGTRPAPAADPDPLIERQRTGPGFGAAELAHDEDAGVRQPGGEGLEHAGESQLERVMTDGVAANVVVDPLDDDELRRRLQPHCLLRLQQHGRDVGAVDGKHELVPSNRWIAREDARVEALHGRAVARDPGAVSPI